MRDQPDSLPLHALGGDPRRLEPPVPVRVWICSPRVGWRQLAAEATAWTPRAGHVTYRDEHDREDNIWVWAPAIERR